MKKKVLFFTPFLKARAGGSPKLASTLTTTLGDKYDISIITLLHFEESYPIKGKYYSLHAKSFFLGVLTRLNYLRKIIKSISPDVIVAFMTYTSFWIIPMMYLLRIRVPLIIGATANPESQYKKRFYFKYLMKIFYPLKKLTVLVPVSKELKSILNKKYRIINSKIIPIYIGLDIQKVKEMAKERIEHYEEIFDNPDIIKFITLGRLSGEKGHKYLIEAYSDVLKKIPNSRLIIIGDGKARSKIETMIYSKNLQKHIKLMGYVENPYNYVSKSDIFVLPSLSEGLPYALIEARICKVPIVSTNCETGPKEVLKDGKYGLLVNVGDSKDLAEKMIELAKNKELRDKFSSISQEGIEVFDNKNFVANWEKLIDFCLENL